MNTHSQIQEITNYSELKNSRNKGHSKISESTVFRFGYFQEKEQVKSQAIRKGYDKLLVEYLGKDPEKWPSKDEVGQYMFTLVCSFVICALLLCTFDNKQTVSEC